MAELHQSVVVCNLDGRILLYNGRARALFRACDPPPTAPACRRSGSAGRSARGRPGAHRHARDHRAQHRPRRGRRLQQFVTTTPPGPPPGQPGARVVSASPSAGTSCYSLDDITDDYAAQSSRDHRLIQLTEASRASLASMRAALEMLDYPDLEPAEREQFPPWCATKSRR